MLPSPNGELSHTTGISIVAATKSGSVKVKYGQRYYPPLQHVTQGNYIRFTPKQKAAIGNYAVLHSTSANARKIFPNRNGLLQTTGKLQSLNRRRLMLVGDKSKLMLVDAVSKNAL